MGQREPVGPVKQMLHAGPPLRVGVITMPAGTVVPTHRHDAWEVFVFLAGQATVRSGERERMAGPGEVMVFPPGEPHSVRAASEEVRFVALVAPNDEWR